METRANYVAIGLFVLAVIAAAFGALFYLYRAGESNVTATMQVVFPEAVTGLSTGGSVLFNGIRIGEVTRLQFPPEGGDDVIAIVRVDPTAPIKEDTAAQLASQGLTGVSYISLTGGSGPSLFATPDPTGRLPTLRAQQSTFTNVVDNLQSVLGRLDSTLGEVNQLVAENRGNITGIVGNVRDITGELAQAAPEVRGLVSDVASAGRAVAAAAPQVTSIVGRVNGVLEAVEPGRVASIIRNVDEFSGVLPEVRGRVQEIAGNANGIVTRLQDGADRLGEAITNVRDVTAAVKPEDVATIVGDVRTTAGLFASRSDAIGTLVDNTAAISGDVRRVTTVLGGKSEQVATAVDDASALIGDARRAVQAATPAIEGVGRAIGAIDPARITGIVDGVEKVTTMLSGETENVADFIHSAQSAARSVQDVTRVIAARNTAIERALDNGADLIADLREASRSAPALVQSANRTIETMNGIASAVDAATINRIVRDAGQLSDVLAAKAPDFARLVDSATGIATRGEAVMSALAQRTPQIGASIDNIEQATVSVRAIAGRLPALADKLEPGLENVSAVMASVDPEAVRAIVTDMRGITGTVAAQAPAVERVVRATDAIAADAQAVAANARQLTDDLMGKRDTILAAVDDARAAVASAKGAADSLPGLLDTLRPGLENASAVLSAVDPAAVQGIVSQVRDLADALGAEAPRVSRIVASVEGTAARVEAVTSAVAQRTPQIGAVFDNVEAASSSVRAAAAKAPALIDTLQPGIENVGNALAAVDPAAIEAVVGEVRDLATTLGAQRPAIERIVGAADRFATAVADQAAPLADLVRSANGSAARIEAITSAVAQRTPQIGAAFDNVEAATASARGLVEGLQPGVENVNAVLAAVDPAAVRDIVEDARTLADRVAADTPAIVADVRAAVGDARAIAGDVRAQLPQVTAAVGDVRAAVGDVRRATERVPALIDRLEPGVAALSDALAAVDPDAVATILTNVSDLSTTLAAQRSEIVRIVETAAATAQKVDEITGAVRGKMDVITGAIDDVGRFADEVGAAAPDIETVVAAVTDAATTLRETVAAVDPEAVRSIVADLRSVASAIGSRAGQIGSAIDNVFASAKDLAEGLGSVGGEGGALKETLDRARTIVANVEAVSGKLGPLIDKADAALGEELTTAYAGFNRATDSVERLAAAIEPRADEIADGLARFSKGGLDDLRSVLTQTRSTLASIESAVSSFDRNPSRVIFGGDDAPTYSPKRR